MKLVLDTENNGLLDTITKMWCIVAKDIDTKEVYKFPPDQLQQGLELLKSAPLIIGHNIIAYDFPVMDRLKGFTYTGKVFDTLVVSRLLNPDRRIPKGAKTAHSLEAWGIRMGVHKPAHEDWSQYSEEMMVRCETDVEINEWTYYELLKEMKL